MHIIVVLLLFFTSSLTAASRVLYFDGYISSKNYDQVHQEIGTWDNSIDKVFFVIKSHSADLNAVLDIAKELYSFKAKSQASFVGYINDEALGPAAIVPFLCDELYTSLSAVWGAITSDSAEIPANILQSRIEGFIPSTRPSHDQLIALAKAMLGPNGRVLNQQQMLDEGLVREILKLDQFSSRFFTEEIPLPTREERAEEESTFFEQLKKYIHLSETAKVGHLLINDQMIGQSTWIYVSSALTQYKETKPACIILELNTPGGEVFAAQRISDALKEMDTQYGIPVIAYINNWAISAGAMLAYSCRFIVASKGASMGGAEPVYLGSEGKPESASEKVQSVMRSDFAARAQFFDRDPLIAEAMVDKDIILVLRHGKIVKLDSESEIRKEGLDPDVVISPKGKLLTLDAKQLLSLGVADYVFETQKVEPLTSQEEETGVYPLAKTPFMQVPFFAEYPHLLVESFRMNWQTQFVTFLASPMISSALLLILIISAYIEFSTPGFGIAGTLALVSLFFILLSSYALEAVHWLEPILFLFGLFLVVLEGIFFPTAGILAVVGVVFMIAGLTAMMIPGIASITFEGDALNAAGEYVLMRLTWIAGTILLAGVVIVLLSRYLTFRSRGMKKIVLNDTPHMASTLKTDLDKFIGRHAMVTTTLRPAGKITLDGEDFDAVSSGNYIEEGKEVRVIRVEGAKIIVEEVFS